MGTKSTLQLVTQAFLHCCQPPLVVTVCHTWKAELQQEPTWMRVTRSSPRLLPYCLLGFLERTKPVFSSCVCECFAHCLLFHSCLLHNLWISHEKIPLLLLATSSLISTSNSCCTRWLAAVPRELPPWSDTPAGVLTGCVGWQLISLLICWQRYTPKTISINLGVSFLFLACPTVKCGYLFLERRQLWTYFFFLSQFCICSRCPFMIHHELSLFC